MKYLSAAAFRSAIDARLKRLASEHGQAALARMRKQIVFDRFLARLFAVDTVEWTLKGGVALDYRLGEKARATRDIDLLHTPKVDNLVEELAIVESLDLGDFFRFSIRQTSKLDGLIDGSAIRFHIQADLDGRKFEEFIVDVGFDAPKHLASDIVRRSGFLEFAGLDSPSLPVLAIETHLAEKIHAYARSYSSDRPSSRVKDLVDIVLIGQSFSLKASTCIGAIRDTFESRATQPIPSQLVLPPENWTTTYPALAASVSLDPDIAVGHAFAANMLNPLLGGAIDDAAIWDASVGEWRID